MSQIWHNERQRKAVESIEFRSFKVYQRIKAFALDPVRTFPRESRPYLKKLENKRKEYLIEKAKEHCARLRHELAQKLKAADGWNETLSAEHFDLIRSVDQMLDQYVLEVNF